MDRGFGSVSGFTELRSVGDAVRYARLSDKAPQITDNLGSLAWLVQFRGDWPDAKTGQSWIDATCMVVGDDPVIYATGPIRDLQTGKILRGYYAEAAVPAWAIPGLEP